MDDYGSTYVDPCRPLVVLSGLSGSTNQPDAPSPLQRNGLKLEGPSPDVPVKVADRIWEQFLEATARPGNGPQQDSSRSHSQLYTFQRCGRAFQFPTRKAVPQASPADSTMYEVTSPAPTSLHSPLSPLSPGSPLYPNGVMTSQWVWKYRNMTPALILAFYSLSSDGNMQSLHDNQMKQELNAVRLRLEESSHKSKFGVVLVGDRSIDDDPALEERLNNIKRTTKLDSKTTFFFIKTDASAAELKSAVESITTAIRAPILDFYKDLTRHTRRKRDRGSSSSSSSSVPSTPTTPGVSQNLGRHAWNARYEFKLGIFADFRSEPDVAARHYNASLDSLFHPDGFFETVTNWSPRWNETRLFADVVAIRFIRCQLLNGLPSSAVMFWTHYRSRFLDILQRKGKGTADYGWQAWEARWSAAMADLSRDNLFPLQADKSQITSKSSLLGAVYMPAEKQIQSDDPLHPWHLLHHPGYWYKLAAAFTKARRWLATKIPVEDRLPPGQSPAAAVARRSEIYDTYLCPDPPDEYRDVEDGGSVHDQLLIQYLGDAAKQFSQRDQKRMANFLRLSLGKQLMSANKHQDAHSVLKQTWQDSTWRRDQWWSLIGDAALSVHLSARKVEDFETQIVTLWELSHQRTEPIEQIRYDFSNLMEKLAEGADEAERVVVHIDTSQITSWLSAVCIFPKSQGHAGELTPIRLVIYSSAHEKVPEVVLNSVEMSFSGSPLKVKISNTSKTDESVSPESQEDKAVQALSLVEEEIASFVWTGQACLALKPGETKVFDSSIIFREPGTISQDSIVMTMEKGNAAIETVIQATISEKLLMMSKPALLPGIRTLRSSPQQLTVLPKPPKLRIQVLRLEKVYYLDEKASVVLELTNEEAEDINVTAKMQLLGQGENGFRMGWSNEGEPSTIPENTSLDWKLGAMPAAETRRRAIALQVPALPADMSLEISVNYTLESDRNTPISQVVTLDAIAVRPFEAAFSVLPRVHPDPWPSFFAPAETTSEADTESSTKASGILTRWSLVASLQSLASSEIVVDETILTISGVSAEGRAVILGKETAPGQKVTVESPSLAPKAMLEQAFALDVQRADLDERRTTSATGNLEVIWKRSGTQDAESVRTVLDIPRMAFANGEPRVLASLVPASDEDMGAIFFNYTLENPTLHFLSFGITMELSEGYAFSGPKGMTVSLLPMSRRCLQYTLVPLKRGFWLQPKLKVVDLYFNKTLEVQATGDLVLGEQGVQFWVGDEDE